jgi:hypothetical protein
VLKIKKIYLRMDEDGKFKKKNKLLISNPTSKKKNLKHKRIAT